MVALSILSTPFTHETRRLYTPVAHMEMLLLGWAYGERIWSTYVDLSLIRPQMSISDI